ncbi:hypothetical protein SAMN05421813_11153 [Daejeonella rubra]|uniref:Uncharacterized protein n=1 Tax=Daejeonella rubra TaxID=990371 RepID=A0A1G9SW38_9SPHI|nr:hypothetical protein SAMN05421813_11153 [Daejeonella rubra]
MSKFMFQIMDFSNNITVNYIELTVNSFHLNVGFQNPNLILL